MNTLQISPATEAEFVAALGLMEENMGRYHLTHNIPWDEEWLRTNYRDKDNYSLFVAETWLGFLSLERQEDAIFVHTLQLLPTEQGRGIGRQVSQWLSEHASRRGLRRITCKSFRDNPALAWYRRLGFQQIEEEGFLVKLELELTPKPEGDYSEESTYTVVV